MKKRYVWDNDPEHSEGCLFFDTQYFFKRLDQHPKTGEEEDKTNLYLEALTGISEEISYRTGPAKKRIHESIQAAIEYFPKLFPPKYHNQIKQELCYAALKGDKTARKILQAWEGEK